MSRRIPFILLLVIVSLLMLVQPVLAGQNYLILSFDAQASDVSSISLQVIEQTEYHSGYFIKSEPPVDDDYTWRLSGSDGTILFQAKAYAGINNLAAYDARYARLELMEDGQVVHSQRIDFCDADGSCEPCGSQGPDGACRLFENSLTCSDCPSGSSDNYCDLFRDGVCDPDCNSADADCKGCTAATCYYRDTVVESVSCESDLYGEICEPGIPCTGKFVYADDSGSRCCVEGVCDHPPTQPSCAINGGVLCPPESSCTGEITFYHHTGYGCCIGGLCGDEEPPGPIIPVPGDGLLTKLGDKLGVVVLVFLEILLIIVIIIAVIRRHRR